MFTFNCLILETLFESVRIGHFWLWDHETIDQVLWYGLLFSTYAVIFASIEQKPEFIIYDFPTFSDFPVFLVSEKHNVFQDFYSSFIFCQKIVLTFHKYFDRLHSQHSEESKHLQQTRKPFAFIIVSLLRRKLKCFVVIDITI